MSQTTPAPPRRKRMSRAEREQQMLDVAEEVFAEEGYRAVSMDTIADRCGVSKPLIYEYFGSKDGLFLACVGRARAELYDATRAAMDRGDGPAEVLWLGLVAYYEFTHGHSRSFALLLQEPMALPDSTVEAVESVRQQQHQLIAPVLATFAPDAPATTIEAYTEIIIGACERISLWCARRPEITPEIAAQHTLDFCWHGLEKLFGSP
ncbi:MAG: TetR/AcrR family transcriptional regulator [Streptosporangiaceae bacterium]